MRVLHRKVSEGEDSDDPALVQPSDWNEEHEVSGLQEALSAVAVPAGAVMPFATAAPPAGWLVCDGAAVSRDDYAALFAAVGTLYGVGDGATTFALPDLRGEFVRGWDGGRGVDPGRALGSAQGMAVQPHNHSMPTGQVGEPGYAGFATVSAAGVRKSTDVSGGAETRPRNVALLYCIKA